MAPAARRKSPALAGGRKTMNIKLVALCAVPALAGCLSSAPKAPVNWTVEPVATAVERAQAQKYGAVRVAQVSVRAPYDGLRLAVLRRDGSVAFDPFNSFASSPSALLRGAAHDVAEASGLFGCVLHQASSAAAPFVLEVTVTRLALDCRVEGSRTASVELTATLVGGRDVVDVARGAGTSPAGAGDYTAAFSSAFTSAMSEALRKL